ncbi:MAG: histidine phosphatase family protein [Acidobacteriota bacterium]
MKTLLLLRHGKSDWDAPFDSDRERPISLRGQRAARLMGSFLSTVGAQPDVVVTSPALRARTTVNLAAESGAWESERYQDDCLYEGTAVEMLEILKRQPQAVSTLLLAGHQPTFSELAARLIGGGNLRIPTAAIACLELAVNEWPDIAPGCAELRWLLPPKLLKKAGWGPRQL